MVGGFASIVQTQITDTYNLIKENKKIFRFEAKKRITEAKECSDELIDAFMHYMKECGMSQLWMDMTDNIEDELKPDIQNASMPLITSSSSITSKSIRCTQCS